MPIPDVTMTFRDGALGLPPPSSTNAVVHIGLSPLGQANTIYSLSDPNTVGKTLGNAGQLPEAVALHIQYAGGPAYAVPVNPGGTSGSVSAVTKTGVGADTLTVAAKNSILLTVKIVLGGAAGTATFQVSYDGGVTYPYAAQTSVALGAAVQITGGNCISLAFTGAVAGSFVAGDIWTITTAGVATLSGTGTGTVAIHANTGPVDAYTVQVNMTLGGALGVSQFTYSLDGNLTTSGVITTPTSGIFVIPDTGIVLTFAGTSTSGNFYNFTTTPQAYGSADITSAITAIVNSSTLFNGIHVMGASTSVSGAAALLASLDTQLNSAAVNQYKFMTATIEVPTDTDANIAAAFNASSSVWVGAAVSTAVIASPMKPYQLARSAGWLWAARFGRVPPQNDFGRVADKSLPSVISLTRDERQTQLLDAQRFSTLRTITGIQGSYFTKGRLMSPFGSDFALVQYRRVMNILAAAIRNSALQFLNDSVLIDPTTGFIVESSARAIEDALTAAANAATAQQGMCSPLRSGSDIAVNRANNILTTQQLQITVRATPLGYASSIPIDIGFSNPAIQIKAF